MATKLKHDSVALPLEIGSADEAAVAVRAVLGEMNQNPELRDAMGVAVVGNPITVEIVPTADAWAEKQVRRAQAAGDDWLRGIQHPSADFKQAAIAAKGKHRTRTEEALRDDRYAKSMAKVDTNEAIETAIRVGSSGFANGIAVRENKIKRVVADLQPRIAAVKRTIAAMPQDTDAAREQRLLAARKAMIEVGKARRG